jgi:hypothetical protein
MRKPHFNEQSLVLLGPIISMFFACSNEDKNQSKQQRMRTLVLSLCSTNVGKNFADECWSNLPSIPARRRFPEERNLVGTESADGCSLDWPETKQNKATVRLSHRHL